MFFEVDKEEEPLYAAAVGGKEVSFNGEKLTEKNIETAKNAEVICIFINSPISKDIIDALPNLKFIATRSTGTNHIDVAYAKAKGIKVSNVPAYGSHTVAEFTFGLILNLSRKIIKANDYIRGTADFNFLPMMEGFDLMGKTLGVIGTGKIGKNVVKIAKGFGMNILAYDIYPDQAFAKENSFEYKTLPEVVSGSDIITLHTPYTKENHHLLNKEKISAMKKGAFIVNTARGELIDTDALIWGLNEGIIGGAALDVLEGEKELKEEMEILSSSARPASLEGYKMLLEDHALMDMPNVIVTPHVAFYTKEAVAEIIKITAANIDGFATGSPSNLIE